MSIADKLTQIAENVPKVYEAGYEKGKAEGGGDGGSYDEGFEAGKKAEHDAFWDAYQANGDRLEYYFAFSGKGWTNETFRPKYDIHMRSSVIGAFEYNEVTDLVKTLRDCGISMDTDGAINMQATFAYAKTKSLPALNASKVTNMASTFEACRNLERIESLSVQKSTTYNSTFKNCDALKHIVFEGEIGNNLGLQYSPLSKASIESVVTHLSDTTTGKTLSLSKAAVENAFRTTEVNILGSPFDGGTHTENGVTFKDNGDGTIDAQGTATGDAFYELKSNISVPKGAYTIHKPTDGDIFVSLSDGREFNYQTPTFVVDEDGITANIILLYSGEGTTKITPKIMMASEWDTIAATKPNWTISLV